MKTCSKSYLKDLTYQITGACIEVHKLIGPGHFESVYLKCLKRELELRGIRYESEFRVPVHYKGLEIDTDLRCDLLIEEVLAVELKAVESLLPVHEAQIITYMNLLHVPKGIIVNFNVANLYREGQKTFVNEMFRDLPD